MNRSYEFIVGSEVLNRSNGQKGTVINRPDAGGADYDVQTVWIQWRGGSGITPYPRGMVPREIVVESIPQRPSTSALASPARQRAPEAAPPRLAVSAAEPERGRPSAASAAPRRLAPSAASQGLYRRGSVVPAGVPPLLSRGEGRRSDRTRPGTIKHVLNQVDSGGINSAVVSRIESLADTILHDFKLNGVSSTIRSGRRSPFHATDSIGRLGELSVGTAPPAYLNCGVRGLAGGFCPDEDILDRQMIALLHQRGVRLASPWNGTVTNVTAEAFPVMQHGQIYSIEIDDGPLRRGRDEAIRMARVERRYQTAANEASSRFDEWRSQRISPFLRHLVRNGAEDVAIVSDAHRGGVFSEALKQLSPAQLARIHHLENSIGGRGADSAALTRAGTKLWRSVSEVGENVSYSPAGAAAATIRGQSTIFGEVAYSLQDPEGVTVHILANQPGIVPGNPAHVFSVSFTSTTRCIGIFEITILLALNSGFIRDEEEALSRTYLNDKTSVLDIYRRVQDFAESIYPADDPDREDKIKNLINCILTCLKPQGDSSHLISARTHIGMRTAVLTGDRRLFWNCAKNDVTAMYIGRTTFRFYQGPDGIRGGPRQGVAGMYDRFMGFMREGLNRVAQAVGRDHETIEKRERRERAIQSARHMIYLTRVAYHIANDNLKTELERLRPGMRPTAYTASLEEKKREATADLQLALNNYKRLTGSYFRGGKRGGGPGDDEDKLEDNEDTQLEKENWFIEMYSQIVYAMSYYLINNIAQLQRYSVDRIPDVFFYVLPFVEFPPTLFGFKDEVGYYVNNPYIRMPVLDIAKALLRPCFENIGDEEETNRCIDSFFEGCGYYVDEPIVDVVKRIVRGDIIEDGEIENDEFNGIAFIYEQDNAFREWRPAAVRRVSLAPPALGRTISDASSLVRSGPPMSAAPPPPPPVLGRTVSDGSSLVRGGPPMLAASALPASKAVSSSMMLVANPKTSSYASTGKRSGPYETPERLKGYKSPDDGGEPSVAAPLLATPAPPAIKRTTWTAHAGGTRRQQRRQQQKLRTQKQQKKASTLGGLQATFEIIP